jgi:hypothetical protein
MSERKLEAEFAPDGFHPWKLWSRPPLSTGDSEYFFTLVDPETGAESGYPIKQEVIQALPLHWETFRPATLWFLLDHGTQEEKLVRLAQHRPGMLKAIHSQVSLRAWINEPANQSTALLEVIKTNQHQIIPDLLKMGANPFADIQTSTDPLVPEWTTAFDQALASDRVRILRHFLNARPLKPKHLRECREKYSANKATVPPEEAEHVKKLLDDVNRRLGSEPPDQRDNPSSGERPKVW